MPESPGYAGFWRRLGALGIDQILLLLIQGLVLFPVSVYMIYERSSGLELFELTWLSLYVLQYWLYAALFEHSRWQATPGKFLLGLKVTDTRNRPLTFWRSSWRLLIQYVVLFGPLFFTIGIIIGASGLGKILEQGNVPRFQLNYVIGLTIGFCYVIFNNKRQTLFDRLAGRLVVFQADYPNRRDCPPLVTIAFALKRMPTQISEFFRLAKAQNRLQRFKLISAVAMCSIVYLLTFAGLAEVLKTAAEVESNAKHGKLMARRERFSSQGPDMAFMYNSLCLWTESLGFEQLAAGLMDRAVIANPGTDQLEERANFHYRHNRLDLAEKDLLKALDLNDQERFPSHAGSLYYLLSCIEASREHASKAIHYAREATKAAPYHRQTLDLWTAIKKDGLPCPYDLEVLKKLSEGSYGLGPSEEFSDNSAAHEKKIAECDAVLAAAPDCTRAARVKIYSLEKLQRFGDAERLYENILKCNPQNLELALDHASFVAEHRKSKAVEAYRRVARIKDVSLVHFKAAQALEDIDKKVALEEYNRAIALDPKNHEALYERAELYSDMNEYQKAANDYGVAISVPITRDSYHEVHDLYRLRGTMQEKLGRFEAALKDYEMAISIKPTDAEAVLSKAELLAKMGRNEDALHCYNESIRLADTNVFSHMGPILDTSLALIWPSLRKKYSLSDSPTSYKAKILEGRARTYADLGQIDKGVADYLKARSLDQDLEIAHPACTLLCLKGDYDNAIKIYDTEIKSTPSEAIRYLQRAALEERAGRSTAAESDRVKAREVADSAVSDEPKSENYYQRARVLLALGEYDKALSDINLAIARENDVSSYYSLRAAVYSCQHNIKAALHNVDLARKESDGCACEDLDLGKTLLRCGKYKESIAMLDKAIDSDFRYAEAYFARSNAYKKLGRLDLAARDESLAAKYGYFKDPTLGLEP